MEVSLSSRMDIRKYRGRAVQKIKNLGQRSGRGMQNRKRSARDD